MKENICILSLLVFLSSCTGNTQTLSDESSSGIIDITSQQTENSGSIEEVQAPLQNITQTGSDMSAFLNNSENDSIALSHTSGKKSTISFINDSKATLTVKISFPNRDTGNLRLSQIIMPDGTMDGPFGTESTYELTQLGGYQLLFGENQMSGDPWSGEALVELNRKIQ